MLKGYSKIQITFTEWLTFVFAMISVIGILNHEIWRDEAQAWLIGANSSSLSELFQILRYEGHPGLWHTLLYFISHLSHDPLAMQLFHLLIAAGVVYIFARFSPFTQAQKILFTFGYFPFFEYNLISRNYSLGVLLIFIFCSSFPKRSQSYIPCAICLALLGSVNAYSFILATCLAITLIIEGIFDKTVYASLFQRKIDISISMLILVLGIAIGLAQLLPPADSIVFDDGNTESVRESLNAGSQFSLRHLASTFSIFWKSYMPIPDVFNYQFWGTNFLLRGTLWSRAIAGILSIAILVFSSLLLVRTPLILFLYLFGTSSIFLFTYRIFLGSIRHYGHLFILFLGCLWLSYYCSKTDFLVNRYQAIVRFADRYKPLYLTAILYIHVLAGVFAFSMDLVHPFSSSKDAANFIKAQQLDHRLIIGSEDVVISSISAFLDQPIYYLELDEFGSFIPAKARESIDSQKALDKVSKLLKHQDNEALLILNFELAASRDEIEIAELAVFKDGIVSEENYYLYSVKQRTELDTML